MNKNQQRRYWRLRGRMERADQLVEASGNGFMPFAKGDPRREKARERYQRARWHAKEIGRRVESQIDEHLPLPMSRAISKLYYLAMLHSQI